MNEQPDVVTKDDEEFEGVYTLTEYAALVGRNKKTIQNQLANWPEILPTPFRLPHYRGVFFNKKAVHEMFRTAEQIANEKDYAKREEKIERARRRRANDEKFAQQTQEYQPVVRRNRGDQDGD